MRNIYLLLFAVLIGVQSVAQDLRQLRLVGEAAKSETEIVTRRDRNGNLTAGIMVISDMDGFAYDSYDGVVGNVDARPGMDIVYVTANERVLEIYKTGFEPLTIILSEIGIRLKPQEVWQIRITGDEIISTLPVVIRYTPDDARLYINNSLTSRAATYSLALGQHNLRIEKEGFQPVERTIIVNEQNIFFEYTLQRQPDAGLQIETTPAGATVYLDGVLLGQTPLAAFYKPGIYPIHIVKEGYVTLENQTLEVALPQTRKSYTLEENVGWLTINTHSGASIWFNDQLIANPKNVKLPPQLVRVKVTMPKAEPLEQQVILKRNDRLTLDMFPEVQTGTIQVAVTPFDAQIELTGDAGEKYSAVGMKVFEDIPVGKYDIRVSAIGYKNFDKSILLTIDEVVIETVNLEDGIEFETDFEIEMVFVKGGTFKMGCSSMEDNNCDDDEKPTQNVKVSGFFIGKHEVTQKQWQVVMGDNPSHFRGCDSCPVDNVSWNDAQDFIRKLNQLTGKRYRLPTEAEWEFAARGGTRSRGFKFAGSNNIDYVAWYLNNSGNKTRPVGQKMSNELGIYDMSGNVWEWCNDWYGMYYNDEMINPQGPFTGNVKVLRGGSWGNTQEVCEVIIREFFGPNGRYDFFGFRLALSEY
jgi:formylglycine-generating enzyme required for sulfatase activity